MSWHRLRLPKEYNGERKCGKSPLVLDSRATAQSGRRYGGLINSMLLGTDWKAAANVLDMQHICLLADYTKP